MLSVLNELEEKIEGKSLVLGVVGLGYVGLPLCLTFLRKGVRVLGFDLDASKIKKLRAGESYIKHIPTEEIKSFIGAAKLDVTDDFARLCEPDVILICVPTPLTASREPDLQYVESTANAIARTLRPGQLVILESTTYPGTTEEILLPALLEKGLVAGQDFFLAYSPEREDPGNPNFSTATIPKVVGGMDESSTRLAVKFYECALEKVIPVSDTKVAELTKLLENIFRSVNIALVNELKVLCHRMGIDVWEVIRAASSKPFGYMPFYPGPGLGGHCIPIDPFYLTSKAREYDFATKFIELAGEVNTEMPYYVVQRVMEALNERRQALNGADILLLGAAYKKDVDDPRESPFFKILQILTQRGAVVQYNDPFIPALWPGRQHSFTMESVPLTEDTLQSADCVVLVTDHSSYDYKFILDHAKLVVDTRNAFGAFKGHPKIVLA